jgi:hypothetical protein
MQKLLAKKKTYLV